MKRESYGLDDLYRDSSCTSFAVIPMMAFPKASEDIITGINSAISDSIGSIYLFMGLAIFFAL